MLVMWVADETTHITSITRTHYTALVTNNIICQNNYIVTVFAVQYLHSTLANYTTGILHEEHYTLSMYLKMIYLSSLKKNLLEL